jgi:hypothetical protein
LKKIIFISSRFVHAKVIRKVEMAAHQQLIELTLGKAKLSFPSSASATYLGQVLQSWFDEDVCRCPEVFLHRDVVDFGNYAEYLIMSCE